MGSDMYHFMSRLSTSTPRIEFGLAALKCIRLLTSALGGEGWLTFMGNEFGHPEWIDFPRKGNGFSMERARRRWDLVDDALLRYRWLNDFDRAMNEAALACGWLSSPHARVLCASEPDQLVVFERAALLFVANLHPERALNSYALDGVRARYPTLVLSSDDALWGGRSRTVCVQPGAAAGEALLTVPPACIFVVSSEE
jgi:1,4-alpha-glucan branching enzyme